MRRLALSAALLVALTAPTAVRAHEEFLDHAPPNFSQVAPPSRAFQSGGQNAEWEMVGTIPTGNPMTDLDFFTRGGDTYASVGTLAIGPNGGGQTIVRLTQGGEVRPSYVTGHPSATCVSRPDAALGLQHDAEATPKGNPFVLGNPNPFARLGDAQLLLDATDQRGRCHDQGILGVAGSPPRGGIEIVDITDPAKPFEIGLTSHIGEAHTVNIDPKRPHIAYAVTSDSVGVNAQGVRANETDENLSLDGFEVIDLSSCMNLPAGMTKQQKRAACRPQVYRFRWPSTAIALGHMRKNAVWGCHELEIYPDDRLACAAGAATMLFDMSGAFDDRGTPNDFSDDKPRGTPLPCKGRPSSTPAGTPFATGAQVTDCADPDPVAAGFELDVFDWIKMGSPSLEGVRYLGAAFHMGRQAAGDSGNADPNQDSTQDLDFSHEAELTQSGRFLLASDERGGGVLPPGATCSPGADLKFGNGGIQAFRVDRLLTSSPSQREDAWQSYARTSSGAKAIYRAPIRTQPQGSICTAHVFQQIPGQNRIFMGWYSQGTQVVDFTENPDGTIDFKEAAFFIPANANQWVSHIFKAQRNANGTFTYWGATGDFNVGAAGRNAIDIYKVTLPPPPTPRIAADATPPNPQAVGGGGAGSGGGVPVAQRIPDAPSTGPGACVASTGFRSAAARAKGRGLSFAFQRRTSAPVTIEVFQSSAGRRVVSGRRPVISFTGRTRSFSWNGKLRGRRLADGHYLVRFRGRGAGGRVDDRLFGFELRRGRFAARPAFQRLDSCGLLAVARLARPVFGGDNRRSLNVFFRVSTSSQVRILVQRGSRTVRTIGPKNYPAGRLNRVNVSAKGLKDGSYRIVLLAKSGRRQATATLFTRKL